MRKRRKQHERDLVTIRAFYETLSHDFRVPGTTTFSQLEEQVATHFGVAPKFARNVRVVCVSRLFFLADRFACQHYRLRRWDAHHGVPRETFGARPQATMSTIHLGADSLRLEVLPAHVDAFMEYDYNSVSVKVHLYDAQANDFSPANIFTFPSRNDKLRVVKYQLAHEYGMQPDGIRLFKETVPSVYSDPANSSGTVELFGDE